MVAVFGKKVHTTPKGDLKPVAEERLERPRTSLSSSERNIKDQAHLELLDRLDLSLIHTIAAEEARAQIREVSHTVLDQLSAPLNAESRGRVVKCIEDEILGLGPLEPLLHDPSISDILVNGPNQVYIERHGKLQLTDVPFSSERHLLNIIARIVSAVASTNRRRWSTPVLPTAHGSTPSFRRWRWTARACPFAGSPKSC
jgi:pilus assembly protein CpaF